MPGRLLAVLPDEALAASLVEETAAWAPGETVERVVPADPGDPQGLPPGWERIARARLVVAGPRALAGGVPDPEAVGAAATRLRAGCRADPDALLAAWVGAGFLRQDVVCEPGDCARRGGILDAWGAGAERPVRIEFSDDAIASIRTFDPQSQRSLQPVPEAVVLAPGGVAASRKVPVHEALRPDAVVWVEPERVQEAVGRLESPASWFASLAALPSLRLRSLPGPSGSVPGPEMRTLTRLEGAPASALQALSEECGALWVFAERAAEGERVCALLRSRGLPASVRASTVRGRLRGGFLLAGARVACVGVDLLLGRAPLAARGRALPVRSRLQPDLGELHPNDLVVHPSHGIGRYAGTQVVERSGVPGALQEFLVLEYAEGATLLVPPDEMDLVRRYVGAGDGRPLLDRLRSEAWSVRTARVAAATRGLAEELLRIQALRQSRRGYAIAPDPALEAEFLAAFPYEETPDQHEADEAIRADQNSARPMDRLLCGDVGFGKTELAMRAAFRAVAAGRQVAVLVPTTVLALQHEATFRGRMAAFPVRVGMISRLRTGREQQAVLEAAASGACDVVIGTHRLLSGDVVFRNLGLVVVDEEQRFGVEHKAALQRLRSQVDVVSLSATPIPRTLHMAMVGLRDISNLATPPKERLPIRTVLMREEEGRIRRAILSELSRGGQVFYVHNRVQGIEEACARLRDLIPEAKVDHAHGQMAADELEDVMIRFARRQFDVLVTTTIIESGIDLPNVNTILIERADRFGLAQMHQLRGRVGRFRVQAFCYLLLPRDGPVSQTATRRLRAVEEYSDLGSGFRIALRDLEIRGAGNLLGPEQSGHIAAVGYDLYCRLLASAVRELKGEAAFALDRCEISIPVRALLPESYVDVPQIRLGLYQRMARADSRGALREVEGELTDRFGPPPPEARTLLRLHAVRQGAARAGIAAIGRVQEGLRLEVRDAARAEAALARRGARLRVLGARRLLVPGPSIGEEALQILESLLPV